MRQRPTWAFLLLLPLLLPADAHPNEGKIRLALLPADDRDRELNREILDVTGAAFFRTRRFTLAERHQLDMIIEEKGLKGFLGALSGDPSAAGLDTLTGVDMIGIVDYTKEQGASYQSPAAYWISVRLVSVATSEVTAMINSRRETLFLPTTPTEAAELLFQSIREQFPPQGYVLQIRGDVIYVDIGREMGLEDGDTLEIVEEGETVFSEMTGKPVQLEGSVVGTLKINRASNGSSACKIKKSSRPPAVSDIVRLQIDDEKVMGPVNKVRKFFRRKNRLN